MDGLAVNADIINKPPVDHTASVTSLHGPTLEPLSKHFIRGVYTLPQINMEAHRGKYIEDKNLVMGPSPLPGGGYRG